MRLRILKEETMKDVENDLMTDTIVAIQKVMPTGNLGGRAWWPNCDILGPDLYDEAFRLWFGRGFYANFRDEVLTEDDDFP